MPLYRPFKAFRPKADLAKLIASYPYDVINSDEARVLVKDNPLSFLRVGKPEVDLDKDIDLYSLPVYMKAKENLENLINSNMIVEDDNEYFYIYGLTMNGRTQYGLVGCASAEDYWNDKIKKHEFTRKKKEEDRCNHVRVTNSQSGPIFLTYRDDVRINEIINKKLKSKPENDFLADDGIRHQTWVIKDQKLINEIKLKLAEIDSFYVADGHHRSAAAAIVAKERKEFNPNHRGDEEYNFFLSVLFPASQLFIMDYNRLVKDLNGLTIEEFLEKIKTNFKVTTLKSKVSPKSKGEFGMYIDSKWYKLNAHKKIQSNDPVEGLDVSILQNNILNPILGIEDPRTDERIDFVGGIRGLDELVKRVDSGEMKVAFSMFPTSIEELMSIADSGNVMPPKSTWFEPKLRDGMFIHLI